MLHILCAFAGAVSAAAVAVLEGAGKSTGSFHLVSAGSGVGHKGIHKKGTTLTLSYKREIVRRKDSGLLYTTQDLENSFAKATSVCAVRTVCSVNSRMALRARAASAAPLDCVRVRRSTMEEWESEMRLWYNIVEELGQKTMPLTIAVLQKRAREIGERQSMPGFPASPRFVRRWATWQNLVRISICGTGLSAATDWAAAQERMAETRKNLSAY